ncbi:MAG: hypothetical protein WA125_17460 [Desulfosporosinus sp.]
MKPTELVYLAAKATGNQIVNEKPVNYEYPVGIMPTTDRNCYLCGKEITEGFPRKTVIKPTFTDTPYARAPRSQTICRECTFCLSNKPLRMYSILATPFALKHPIRGEWRDTLLDPPEPPFVLVLATSGQKWLHFKGRVNFKRDNYWILLEEVVIQVSRSKLANLLDVIERLYTTFTKDEIRSGSYNVSRIKTFGTDRWEKLENEIEKERGMRLFELAVMVAKKEKEEVRKNDLRL